MNKIIRSLRAMAMALAAITAVCVATPSALADKVTLKDGRVFEGQIVREEFGYVWIKTTVAGVPREEMFSVDRDVASLERDSATPAPAAAAATPADPEEAEETLLPKKPGEVRGVVLTLGDRANNMVGVYMVANVLEEVIPMLEKEIGTDHTGVVVMRITSGGGYGMEVQKISDAVHNEFKKRWRTVAWIETAISAAAMSAHCFEEIYFTTNGNYGACTGFYGSLDRPVEGLELEESLAQMERISSRGGYDTLIMRAMQIQQPLSATVLPTGEVKWYGDATSGDIVVNRTGEILTFDHVLADKVKFSRGTADTLEELTTLLGYKEINWVGKKVPGVAWPISRAEKRQMDFRKQVKNDEDNLNSWYNLYQTNLGVAQGMPPAQRGPWLGKARSFLDKIKNMIRNNPAFARNLFGGRKEFQEWLKEQERIIAELAKK